MLALDLILGAIFVLAVLWGFWRGVTVSTLAVVGFGAGAVIGARVAPLLLNGGLHSTFAPEAAIPGALVLGAIAAALVERLGLRIRRRLARLGRTSRIGGGVLGAALGVMLVWIIGTVAIEFNSLRNDVRKSEILKRLDAVLTPPGPRLLPPIVYSDPFPTFQGPSAATGPVDPVVTRAPGVRAATRSVTRIDVHYCHAAKGGTGWIAADGIVATNAHVVAAGETIAVQFRGQRVGYPASAIWFDPKNDLALLRVPGVRGRPALTIAPDPQPGTLGAMLGFPGGRWADRPVRLGPTSNMVVGQLGRLPLLPREFSYELFGRLITTYSGRPDHGSSGSPLVDRAGRVLATDFSAGGSSGLAVPNRVVRYALRHAGPRVGTGPCPPGYS